MKNPLTFRRTMQQPHLSRIFMAAICCFLVFTACKDSDSSHFSITDETTPPLAGTWRQTAMGGEKVSGIDVKITFTETTMTMDAPGCLIIGDYTTAGDILTYTVTSALGERCAQGQTGKKDRVKFSLQENRLAMTPLFASEDKQARYIKIAP